MFISASDCLEVGLNESFDQDIFTLWHLTNTLMAMSTRVPGHLHLTLKANRVRESKCTSSLVCCEKYVSAWQGALKTFCVVGSCGGKMGTLYLTTLLQVGLSPP